MSPSHFVYKLIPPRPTFALTMTDSERAVMEEHSAYWTGLFDQGRVAVYGVVLEETGGWGLAVVEAEAEEDVHAMGAGDPAVRTGMCTYQVGVMPNPSVRPAPTAV